MEKMLPVTGPNGRVFWVAESIHKRMFPAAQDTGSEPEPTQPVEEKAASAKRATTAKATKARRKTAQKATNSRSRRRSPASAVSPDD